MGRAPAGDVFHRAEKTARDCAVKIKLQTPSSNIQRNLKPQAPKSVRTLFGAWGLRFLWMLELGVWSLIFTAQSRAVFSARWKTSPAGARPIRRPVQMPPGFRW